MLKQQLIFPEEEINFLSEGPIHQNLTELKQRLDEIESQAAQGCLLQEGVTVVLVGRPNAGKSSLLNHFAGRDTAIVTDIPGTTRDLLQESIDIEGISVKMIDTAGLRESKDPIEREGILRAEKALQSADLILFVHDASTGLEVDEQLEMLPDEIPRLVIQNKMDLVDSKLFSEQFEGFENPKGSIESDTLFISMKQNKGLRSLKSRLKNKLSLYGDGEFSARRRHLEALREAKQHIQTGQTVFIQTGAGELLAEELRYSQLALSRITGAFHSDDLLGEVFSSFCIGK